MDSAPVLELVKPSSEAVPKRGTCTRWAVSCKCSNAAVV